MLINNIYKKTSLVLGKYGLKKRIRELEGLLCDNCIVLLATPEYCNLGDHLIAEAAIKLLSNALPDYPVIEITREIYEKEPDLIDKLLRKESVKAIFITGGGFLGSLWEQMDNIVLRILSVCKDKKVFILPQTIFYEPGTSERFKVDKKMFEEVANLRVFVRDESSYRLCLNSELLAKDHVSLKPDMALFLFPYPCEKQVRKGVALCIRNDKENTLSKTQLYELNSFVKRISNGRVTNIETVDKYRSFLPQKRKAELIKFANITASKELIITNRLHCMVFCYLSHTPCIAIDNISKKIFGVYEWIRDCNYISCIQEFSFDNIYSAYDKIMSSDKNEYDDSNIQEAFKEMEKEIKGGLND